MINLSTSTAAHAYACRTTGSGMVVGRDVSSSRSSRSLRHTVGTTDAVGGTGSVIGTDGALDMLSQGYTNINGFRNNRFQYEIPTVGQHYGNAFHLGEDDEEVADFIIEHHHLTNTDVQTIMEEHMAEDDDDDEDVEMSTAVEVISIDPNCDYDTDEEDDENDEEVKYENGTDVGKVQQYEIDEEEIEEMEENEFTQSSKAALQNEPKEEECDGDVIGRYRVDRGVHCQVMEETVVSGDRSRSRSCSNTDGSSSTSSSSRDSSISSTNSNANVANSTIFSNPRTDDQHKITNIPQNHQDSYHSDEEIDENEDEEEDEEEDDDPDLDFSPTKNTLWELPAKLLQDKSGPKKTKTQPPGRRKRCSSSQRQSFSMPQSPVGAGTIYSGGSVGAAPLPTSLSFDDLESLVCDLSPTKILPIERVTNNDEEVDDLLDDQLADPENFDLAAYITGDDSTSCDTNSERFTSSGSKTPKSSGGTHHNNQHAKSPVKRALPKSRGKEIKVLRQLMLPQEQKRLGMENMVEKQEDFTNLKRDSAAKAVRKLTMDEEESSEAEDEHIAQRTSPQAEHQEEFGGIRRGRKRKAADDTDKDPTWNPNGGTKSKTEVKQSNHKPSTTNNVTGVVSAATASNVHNVSSKQAGTSGNQCGSSTSSSEEGDTCASKPSSLGTKGVKFGQVIKTETAARMQPVSLSKKSLTNTSQKASNVKTMVRDHQAQTNVHRKKTNVKLDHDYCSPKRGSLMHATPGGNIPSTHGAFGGQQRKTIEIPFLMPMKEQLKQERKLQKEKKRVDQSGPAKKHPSPLGVTPTTSDSGKDKQIQQHHRSCNGKESVSVTNNAQKTASTVIPPLSDGDHSLTAFEPKRTDVDKTFVNKIATGSSDSSGANETNHSDVSSCEVKKFAIPNASVGGGGAVKRQISLLKINQPTAVLTKPADDGIASHVSASSQVKIGDTIRGGSISVALNGEANQVVEGGSVKKETLTTPDSTTPEEVSNHKHEVVVRKKLNLQEYKKRREHPMSVLESAPKASNSIQRSQVKSDRYNDSLLNVSCGYSNSTVPASYSVAIQKPEPTIAKPDTSLSSQSSKSTVTATEPLDPISAAKMKALRMQQLKKEAVIKSNEAKLSQKTIPLMPIVPLAQITSLEFDEHGNPLPFNETKAGQGADATGHDAFKLHPDYEEIIIVSIGCNTALTLSPAEKDIESMVDQLQRNLEDGSGQRQQQQHNQHVSCSDKEASRLLDISDTIKRCCPSVDTMPGNSLIASIQEVVIKNSNISSSNHSAGGGGNVTTSSQTVLVGDEASVAERAVTLKAEAISVGAATNSAEGGRTHEQQQQYLLHQSSPYVGVSPPSSFSPGKPERAQTTNTCMGEYAMQSSSPSKQIRSSKAVVNEKTIRTSSVAVAAQTAIDNTSATTAVEHGEDKVIMHLRKDRMRTQRVDATTQTDPSGRFPPLCKLAPPRVQTVEQMQSSGETRKDSRQREQKRTDRRSYRRHRRRNGSKSPSDADSDAADRPPFSRSKSHHERHRAWDRRSRSRSCSRSRHRSSRRRSSCSSGSRSRSRSGYSSRVHHNHHSQQQQQQIIAGSGNNGCNNGSRYSRSRRKSRTCSRSSSSTSSSRYGSRGRRSLSSASSCSSMSSSDASDGEFSRRGGDGSHGAMRSSRSRSRSPRSRSRSGMRSSTPDRQRYHSRDHPNPNRRAISPERNIVYVGRLEGNTRKEDLQQKFQPYGKIVKITLHMKANGSRYGFVTFEKPQHAYDAIDARGTDPNLRTYDVSFGGRRAFCRTQYADLDGEVSNDHDHQIPYVTLDGSLLLPARGPLPYSVPAMCHKEPTYGGGGGVVSGGGAGESFDDLLKKFKKEICARKT